MSTPTQRKLRSADYLLYELSLGGKEQLQAICGASNFATDNYKSHPSAYASFAFDVPSCYMQNGATRAILFAHYNGTRSITFLRNGRSIGQVVKIAPHDFEQTWWDNTACAVRFPVSSLLPPWVCPQFFLGYKILFCEGARNTFPLPFLQYCLGLHATKDWGDLRKVDRASNETALVDGGRLLSSYTAQNGERLWIITEAEDDNGVRYSTSLLLPGEY